MACQTMLTITLISFRRDSKQVVPSAPERVSGLDGNKHLVQ